MSECRLTYENEWQQLKGENSGGLTGLIVTIVVLMMFVVFVHVVFPEPLTSFKEKVSDIGQIEPTQYEEKLKK